MTPKALARNLNAIEYELAEIIALSVDTTPDAILEHLRAAIASLATARVIIAPPSTGAPFLGVVKGDDQ